MGHRNASLHFVLLSDIYNEALHNFRHAISPWIDVVQLPLNATKEPKGRYFFIEGRAGEGSVVLSSKSSFLKDAYIRIVFGGGEFLLHEVRLVEHFFSTHVDARPVAILNRYFTGAGRISIHYSTDSIGDIGDALGFRAEEALAVACTPVDGVWHMRCWGCQCLLPPQLYRSRPFLECVRLAALENVWTLCDTCIARR